MKNANAVKNRSLDFLLGKSALGCVAASLLALAPLVASADNLYKCMGDEGQIYYQDIKCDQAQEAMGFLSINARTGPVKVSPRRVEEGVMLSSPGRALELFASPAKNIQAQPKS